MLDELHTYRGRQGADVALLVRRVREACEATGLQCVGTSATLASGGTYESSDARSRKVASLLFGADVEPRDVIGETLRRATPQCDFDDPRSSASSRSALRERCRATPTSYEAFVADPLSRWIETTFGVEEREGRLARVTPRSISGRDGAAKDLESLTGVDRSRCERAISRAAPRRAMRVKRPDDRLPGFAFRLHQFISKGDTVYASLEPEASVTSRCRVSGSCPATAPDAAPAGVLPRVRPGVLHGPVDEGARARRARTSSRATSATVRTTPRAKPGFLYLEHD